MNIELKPETLQCLEELKDADTPDFDSVILGLFDHSTMLTVDYALLRAENAKLREQVEAAELWSHWDKECDRWTYADAEFGPVIKAMNEARDAFRAMIVDGA